MRLMLIAVTQKWNLVAGQDLSVQRHLPHAPIDAGWIFYANLESGFVIAVHHLVTRPTLGDAGIDLQRLVRRIAVLDWIEPPE